MKFNFKFIMIFAVVLFVMAVSVLNHRILSSLNSGETAGLAPEQTGVSQKMPEPALRAAGVVPVIDPDNDPLAPWHPPVEPATSAGRPDFSSSRSYEPPILNSVLIQ